MKVYNKKILASILFVLISTDCISQDVPCPGCPPDDPLCCETGPPGPPGDVVPIDGFTIVTLVVGAFYGVRKVIQNSNEH